MRVFVRFDQFQFGSILISVYKPDTTRSAVFAVARCPSVALVDCIHAAEDIVKLLVRPVAMSLSFSTPAPVPTSRGTSSAGAQNTRGLKSPFITEAVRDRPLVAMKL